MFTGKLKAKMDNLVYRSKIMDVFRECCADYPKWKKLSEKKRDNIIRRMERSCYNATIKECEAKKIYLSFIDKMFMQRYSANTLRISENLRAIEKIEPLEDMKDGLDAALIKMDGLPVSHGFKIVTDSLAPRYLLDNIIAGKISPADVAFMSSAELNPQANESQRQEVELRLTQKINRKISRAHVCRKCHANETIGIEYQSRANDELSSVSIKCVNCDHVWRL